MERALDVRLTSTTPMRQLTDQTRHTGTVPGVRPGRKHPEPTERVEEAGLAQPNAVRVAITPTRPLGVTHALVLPGRPPKGATQVRPTEPVPHKPITARLKVATP